MGGSVEWATYDGRRYPLSAHEYRGGTIDPHGYRHVEAFRLEGMLPVWTFAFGDALLERRLWMAYGANTTYIRYRLVRGTRPVDLEITPLVTYRDFHALTSRQGQEPQVEPSADAATVRWFDGAQPVRLLTNNGAFSLHGDWYYNFHHREEAARGLDDRSDLYVPGAFTMTLSAGQSATLVLTTESSPEMGGERALGAAQARQVALLHRAGVEEAHPVVQQLVLAADQFVVQRQDYQRAHNGAQAPEMSKTVIAGYHWFNDWGRDTMIAMPGLTVATGRPEDAAGILRTFARYEADGLLPNNFPDAPGADPGYNTADASLWYFVAVHAYYAATG